MKGAWLFVLVTAVVACGAAPPPISLSGAWPTTAGDYREVTRAWTRSGTIRRGYQQVLEVDAVLAAPAWRAADIERRVRLSRMDTAGRAALDAAAHSADQESYEIVVLVTTWDRRENDLDRGERSVWQLTLHDDKGARATPTKVERDRRPRHVIRAEFPSFGDFTQAYRVWFPRTVDALGPSATKAQLRISGAQGAVDLTWTSTR